MEAIPRLMTSHQVNLCEAIITLCLDELRRIFRQQKSKRVCWYVVANKSKFLPNSLFFCTHHSLRLRAQEIQKRSSGESLSYTAACCL